MKKVLIISTSRTEQQLIEEAIRTTPSSIPPGYGELVFDTTASFGQDASWWAQSGPECLFIAFPPDDLMQGYFLTKLKAEVPRSLPLVILCPVISASMMSLSQIFNKVRMLKSPADGYSMVKILVEITTNWGAGQQQIHPRYMTDQQVLVKSDMSDLNLTGKMKNMSLSGAYFETSEKNLQIKSGDILKMSIQSGNPPREYVFDARVVWHRPLDGDSGNGYGVTFVNKEEVYNQLLKGF